MEAEAPACGHHTAKAVKGAALPAWKVDAPPHDVGRALSDLPGLAATMASRASSQTSRTYTRSMMPGPLLPPSCLLLSLSLLLLSLLLLSLPSSRLSAWPRRLRLLDDWGSTGKMSREAPAFWAARALALVPSTGSSSPLQPAASHADTSAAPHASGAHKPTACVRTPHRRLRLPEMAAVLSVDRPVASAMREVSMAAETARTASRQQQQQ